MNFKICPICKGSSKKIFSLYDDRYGHPDKFIYCQCSFCKHIFLENPLSNKEILQLYTKFYSRKKVSVKNLRPRKKLSSFELWKTGGLASAYQWVPPRCKVLDIGCGMGESVFYHKLRGCDAYGIDPDENVLRTKNTFNLNLKHGVFDENSYPNDKFDYITLDQVLEHSNNPIQFMRNVNKSLTKMGRCIISFPNASSLLRKFFGKKWLHWHPPYHVNFYSKRSFENICNMSGFKIIKYKNVTYTAWNFYQVCHLIYYPKKGFASEFWIGTRNKKLNLIRKSLKKINDLSYQNFGIHCIFSRLLDAFGLGDNNLFLLEKNR